MKYNRTDYESFLNIELETQIKEYERTVCTKALVLKERGNVFVGRFIKLQDNGVAVFKIRNSDNLPRKNSFWTASYLIGEMGSFKNWSNYSWAELRHKYQRTCSDALCIWIQKSTESGYCIVGIKGLTIDFAMLLESEKPIIAFGPNDPPLKYLTNLIDVVKDTTSKDVNRVLDYNEIDNSWNPQRIDAKTNFVSLLMEQFASNDCILIQGPPGTGKTYRMAQLAANLIGKGNSVLVTALTNQALMELAKKEDLKPFLTNGKVSKTSLTTDERKELSLLQSVENNKCNASQGKLSLATFYISSGWIKESENKPFDYVIMDEASQALLPMIATTFKLGKKIVLIGDQNQLSPIVITNEDIINDKHWQPMISGFDTVCRNFDFKSYILSDTFRLTQRGADCTGIFYNNSLRSVSDLKELPTHIKEINKYGGPVFVGMELKKGLLSPINAYNYICDLVKRIILENPKAEIAILAKFIDTVKDLQKHFVIEWHKNELPDNIKIETVDRVQGLTVDFCFFLIPNTSLIRSLENALFNVATSRAKQATIIVADKNIMSEPMSDEVRKYLLKAQEDSFATFESKEPKTISSGNIKVSVVGKIDLPENKGKTYVIDTNVFVDCPDIINKIGNKNKIIIPAKVLDELDKLKLKPETDKQKLNKASRNIAEAFTKKFSKMEAADVSLLPVGFDSKTPDCMILSVALKHKDENVIFLTSDLNLQARASGLEIKTKSLREFLKNN